MGGQEFGGGLNGSMSFDFACSSESVITRDWAQ